MCSDWRLRSSYTEPHPSFTSFYTMASVDFNEDIIASPHHAVYKNVASAFKDITFLPLCGNILSPVRSSHMLEPPLSTQ